MDKDLTIFDDYSNKMTASFKLYAVNESEVNVEIQAQIFSEIQVSIEVPPQNKLSAIYDLVEAPLTSSVNHPVIDSFVTSDTPYNTMNYGENKSLMVGKNIKGNHIGLIQFDLSHISPTVVLQGARLRIYYSYLEDMTDIALYTGRDEWSELGVTYLNRPRTQKFVTNEYTVSKEENYIEFDVTSTVLAWLNGAKNNGFILTSESMASVFRSRESTYSPAIYVDYKEPPTHKSDYRKISVDLMVRGLAEDTINVEFTVHSEYKDDSIDIELLVHNPNDIIESDVLVDIESVAKPVFNDDSEILVEITSVLENTSSISVDIEVLKHEAEDGIDVELWVQREDSNEIDVDITVMGVNKINDESSIDVDIDVIGLYINSENDIYVNIMAIGYTNADAHINTELLVADRVESDSIINVDIDVINYTNTESNIHVDIEVPSYANKNSIDVILEVINYSDTMSTINVDIEVPEFNKEDSVDVEITAIKYFELNSSINSEITVADRIESESNIDVELTTQEAIRYDSEDSIDITIYARVPTTSDINVEITVPHYDKEDKVLVELEVRASEGYYAYVYMI